ncbi:MAG: anthranilate phosphoribosyltransferase [Opitutales bacterium]|nr:anthranilate phosphoribosyltransferase [Opitutales bacterium]
MNSSPLPELTLSVTQGHELTYEQISQSIDSLIGPETIESEKLLFLKAMSEKGETASEFSHYVNGFRNRSIDPGLEAFSPHAIDLCGTGGDKAGSFNVSTFVSFLVASGGVDVIKHGNRSISSKCGSADLIEAIGIPLAPSKHILVEGLKALNFSFLFAPQYHPAFKHIAPIRKKLAEQGILTFFNVMGPMINPARPAHQLVGTYNPAYLERMMQALENNGLNSALVAHCVIERDEVKGVDELTACGENLVTGFGKIKTDGVESWSAEKWGQNNACLSELAGGDLDQNLKIMENILGRNCSAGLLSTILINASTAFKLCGKVGSLGEGIELAESLIVDGKTKKWIEKTYSFFQQS